MNARFSFLHCSRVGLLLLGLQCAGLGGADAQRAPKPVPARQQGAFYTGKYPSLLREAGYSQAAIDQKVAQAYHDVFEGPHKVYFEVGDSMAYVSDVKNEDARTEGLSYGMMVAVRPTSKAEQYVKHAWLLDYF